MSVTSQERSGTIGAWPAESGVAYSIGTLVTDAALYSRMKASFRSGGFVEADCEYLPVDNTGASQTSAYAGLNRVLTAARGRYVILCHQDVELLSDGRSALDSRLDELERLDPSWAVAANAGGVEPGRLALRISDPHGNDQRVGRFPQRVVSVDENFIIVKRAARIGFSNDLSGFHFYGADICMAAEVMGYSAYVIDFHLRHLSPGNSKTAEFAASLAAFERKWSRALRPRFVQTTCALAAVSGSRLGSVVRRAVAPRLAKLARRRAAKRAK